VALCAALAHDPSLLLVDEPAGELDAQNAAVVYELLAELTASGGAAALIVSHDPAAAEIANRVVHVRDGKVVTEGEPDSVAPVDLRADGGRPSSPGDGVVAELRRLRKAFRAGDGERIVLEGLDLRVSKGRLTAVVGRSGTGKTTLLHLLAGLERPTAGDVVVCGDALNGKGRAELAAFRRDHVALVTQEPGLVPHLSAWENVVLALRLRANGVPSSRASEALDEVGLGHKRDQRVTTLSAGERQRVAIARALAAGTPLLLVDEPTARLDVESAQVVGVLLARAARERGLAVVCATHDPALIALADEVIDLESPAANLTRAS
jgi:ABC-type lipoprotein export system ATPase subunit